MAELIIEEPCETGKHFSPYKCEFVPKEVILELLLRYPKLSNLVFVDDFKAWLTESHRIVYFGHVLGVCRGHDLNRKKYWNSIGSKKLQEILQRNLNYAKPTYTSGHIYHRAGRIWRDHVGLHWSYKSDGTVTFSIKEQ